MESTFKIWETSRLVYSKFISDYSLEQLNTIPAGFSNNLVWNLGHIIVVQQALVYKLSGLQMLISDELFDKFKNGSKPTPTTLEEIEALKKLLFETFSKTKEDFSNGLFQNFKEFTTGTGFHLTSTKEAIEFNNYHEAIHLGLMMNIRKFI